jgi:hypothetical protein
MVIRLFCHCQRLATSSISLLHSFLAKNEQISKSARFVDLARTPKMCSSFLPWLEAGNSDLGLEVLQKTR